MSKRLVSATLVVLVFPLLCAGQQAVSVENGRRLEMMTSAVPAQIKALDEPAVRAFLQLRAAKFLWAEKSEDAARAAEVMAADALADIQEHQNEIPASYVKMFRKELLAALRLRAPDIATKLIGRYDLQVFADSSETAYEMLSSKDGVSKAVEVMSGNIRSGRERSDSNLNFFLSRLDETHPAEVNRLLADILGSAERAPANYPVPALFGLANQYLYRAATSAELKKRFLTVFIRATANPAAIPEAERVLAYNLLRANARTVEVLLPALHPQASAQTASLASLLPKQPAAQENAERSIQSSADQLAQMVAEADATKDEELRRELLGSAARKALDKGQMKLAVDLIMRLQPRGKDDERELTLYRDQFLGDVARQAAAKKDGEALAYAAASIQDPLQRAAVLQRLALSYYDAQDLGRAREVLSEAYKLIESADDDGRKAVALLNLATYFLKIDDARVLPTAQASVKIINGLPGLKPEEKKGSEAHQRHVQRLLQLAYGLIPVFQRLAQKDEAGAFALAGRFQQPELKATATLGAAMGIPVTGGSASSSTAQSQDE